MTTNLMRDAAGRDSTRNITQTATELSKRAIGVMLAIAFFASCALAQSRDWSDVQRLGASRDIWVETKRGEKFQGELVTVRDNEVVIWSQERDFPGRKLVQRSIPRDDVHTIRLNHRAWSRIAGAVIGVGLGVAIGAAVDARARSHEDDGLTGVTLGILMGAGGGALGNSHPFIKGKIVYQAP